MKNSIKLLGLMITFLLFCPPLVAGEKVDQTISISEGSKVRISVVRGEIEIVGWDKNEVRVVGELDDATEKFIFEERGGEVVINVEIDDGYFHKKWNSDETELEVFMPKSNPLISGGVSSDFEISGLDGGIKSNSVSGDIVVSKVNEQVNVETVSGDISIRDSQGRMNVSTVSGDIETDGQAKYFDAQSVSGDIEAQIGESEKVELTSVSGDIDLLFSIMENGRVDAETVSGDVTLIFEGDDVNARFDIDTGPGGDIRNSITSDRPETSFIGAEEVSFKSGDGSAIVEISTMSGTVSLKQ